MPKSQLATALGSIPASSDTVESEGRQMKQCWIKYFTNCKKLNSDSSSYKHIHFCTNSTHFKNSYLFALIFCLSGACDGRFKGRGSGYSVWCPVFLCTWRPAKVTHCRNSHCLVFSSFCIPSTFIISLSFSISMESSQSNTLSQPSRSRLLVLLYFVHLYVISFSFSSSISYSFNLFSSFLYRSFITYSSSSSLYPILLYLRLLLHLLVLQRFSLSHLFLFLLLLFPLLHLLIHFPLFFPSSSLSPYRWKITAGYIAISANRREYVTTGVTRQQI